ncbi:twin-arginine translocation signal domain-containing protein [candidate division KSB1 bacterium]|nr:twin-arginine translocation signal domain-containing protein [candidate division KSB1 bacterium]
MTLYWKGEIVISNSLDRRKFLKTSAVLTAIAGVNLVPIRSGRE